MGVKIEIIDADITTLDVAAIVNAANGELAPGGGVCGAIHRAAGPDLAAECAHLEPCPIGEARITNGYHLPAERVIHAVGPVWGGGEQGEDADLARCYRNALLLAASHELRSIAFPAISTGIYGFPAPRAAHIAVTTVLEVTARTGSVDCVIFCCFGADSRALHEDALAVLRAVPK